MSSYEGHINARQGMMMMAATTMAMLFLQYPEFLVDAAGPAAWQVALVLTLAAILVFLPTIALVKRFPGEGLAAISEQVAGPFLGPLFTLIVAAWLLFSVTLTMRNFTETFIATILPHTPPSVLIVAVLGCVCYASYRGLEAIARAAQILFPLTLFLGMVTLGFSLPRADGALLYPFWGNGVVNTVRAGLYYMGMVAEVIILLVVGHAFRSAQDVRRSGIYSILLFGVVAAMSVAILMAVLGPQDAAQSPFPLYQLARLIYLGRFLQRVESLIVLFWIFAAALRLCVLFHASVIAIGGALRLPFYRPLIFPLGVIVASLSLLPKDFVTVLRLERDVDRLIGVMMFGVPILLLLVAWIRKKGGHTHAS